MLQTQASRYKCDLPKGPFANRYLVPEQFRTEKFYLELGDAGTYDPLSGSLSLRREETLHDSAGIQGIILIYKLSILNSLQGAGGGSSLVRNVL